jgi:hypothetical protein
MPKPQGMSRLLTRNRGSSNVPGLLRSRETAVRGHVGSVFPSKARDHSAVKCSDATGSDSVSLANTIACE